MYEERGPTMIGRRDGAQPCPITGCPEEASHVAAVWVLGDDLRVELLPDFLPPSA